MRPMERSRPMARKLTTGIQYNFLMGGYISDTTSRLGLRKHLLTIWPPPAGEREHLVFGGLRSRLEHLLPPLSRRQAHQLHAPQIFATRQTFLGLIRMKGRLLRRLHLPNMIQHTLDTLLLHLMTTRRLTIFGCLFGVQIRSCVLPLSLQQ